MKNIGNQLVSTHLKVDNCPFEFDDQKFENKGKFSKSTEPEIKSLECDQYALIQKQDKQDIITIYYNHRQIKQIEVMTIEDEWNYNKMQFNSEFLCVISQSCNILYYHNFNFNLWKYQQFNDKSIILQFLFKYNQLKVVVSKYELYLQLYIIDQQLKLKLLKSLIQMYIPEEQQINAQHRIGFFCKCSDQNYFLISNQTLKPICRLKQAYSVVLNLKNQRAITYLKQYFILLEQQFRTLMIQLSKGKLIRKILQINDSMEAFYQKQLFNHFLIICGQQTECIKVCDIYDSMKGRYVATIYYESCQGTDPIEIKNNYLVLPNQYGYKIKEK